LFSKFGLRTVCHKAKCPNITGCFKEEKFTFMILGDICTRNCRFCNVTKTSQQKVNLSVDNDEPRRISEVVKLLGLRYAVITSVTRDDLADGGAGQFAKTVASLRAIQESIKIEILIPDFQGKISSLECIVDSNPYIIAHNLETVKRLYNEVRPQADYSRSLGILRKIKELNPDIFTKSSLILGMGETEGEVAQAMQDLRRNYCDVLTLGQYLAPSANHYPVKEFISPQQFQRYQGLAINLGFKRVLSGPKVRSSYLAQDLGAGLGYA
jgi:lipoic acid synthetase